MTMCSFPYVAVISFVLPKGCCRLGSNLTPLLPGSALARAACVSCFLRNGQQIPCPFAGCLWEAVVALHAVLLAGS